MTPVAAPQDSATDRETYDIAARTFTGTRGEILHQLDEFIETLVATRLWLTTTPPQRRRWHARFRTLLRDWFGRRAVRMVARCLVGCLTVISVAHAQEPEQPPATASSATPATKDGPFAHVTFGATIEGFYQWNTNEPYDRVTLLRAYDTRANTFGLQQAAIVVESAPRVGDGRRFGARIDLQFGQATETVQGNQANEPRPNVYRNVWQAFGTYVFPVGRGLQADFGKFASSLGYETNYAKDNHHFSRGYLFNFLPFYHAGLRLSLPVANRVTVLYVLTNGIQQTEDFNDFKSQHVAAVLTPIEGVTWTVNYYAGQEQRDDADGRAPDGYFRVFDTYANWAATPSLTVALDVNYVSNEMEQEDDALVLDGLGAYARYQIAAPATLAMRYERLDDEGLFGGIDQVLQELTVTYEHRLADGFLVRGEYRRDWSNESFFTSATLGDLKRDQHTVTAGLVWWFGNKTGSW